MAKILKLDVDGQPSQWISWQDAASYHAKGQVSWSLGETAMVIHGGNNRLTGEQSVITTSSIIAIKGEGGHKKRHRQPSLENPELFRRDRCMCAYCGIVFPESKLTREHIIPRALNGQDIWMNVVTACGKCNQKKDDKTLEQAGMELLYLPYIPSRAEYLLLENKTVLFDQMEFLLAFIPEHSRVHQTAREHLHSKSEKVIYD